MKGQRHAEWQAPKVLWWSPTTGIVFMCLNQQAARMPPNDDVQYVFNKLMISQCTHVHHLSLMCWFDVVKYR